MTKWEPNPKHPIPRHVVQMLVFDSNEDLLIIHRHPDSKSAPNVWSLPSGNHEIGETVEECCERELMEEFDLEALSINLISQYENIAGDENRETQFHWVISLFAVFVKSLDDTVNKEPHKHDKFQEIPFDTVCDIEFFNEYKFHPSLHEPFRKEAENWIDHLIIPLEYQDDLFSEVDDEDE